MHVSCPVFRIVFSLYRVIPRILLDEHQVKTAPHGNSKKSEGYVCTMSTIMDKLKSVSTSNTAKRALAFVSSESGGITKASSATALPRGRQQVNDIRRGSLKSVRSYIFPHDDV